MKYIFLSLFLSISALAAGKIINADIAPSGTANIALNKLAASTSHNACTFDSSGFIAGGVAPGASGNVFTSNGTDWTSAAAVTGVLSLGAFGSSPNVNAGTIAGTVLTLQPADGTHPGGVSIAAQTLAGAKTFSSTPTFSTMTAGSSLFAGTAGILSQDNANYFWDATNHRLGIGTTAPDTPLTVSSNANIPAAITGTGTHIVGADSVNAIDLYDSFAANPALVLRRANTSSSSPSALLSGDMFGILGGQGYGATGYSSTNRASITFRAAENWTDSAQGSAITLNTNPTGSASTGVERVRIDAAGNVGIGTSAPTDFIAGVLTQNGSTTLRLTNANNSTNALSNFIAASDTSNIVFRSNGSGNTQTAYGITLGGYGEVFSNTGNGIIIGTRGQTNPIIFGNSGLERMRILSGGNIGIGTSAPTNKLEVVGNVQASTFTGGVAGTTLGSIALSGNTSGTVTVQPAAAAGTWSMTLPTTGGTNLQFLQTNGSGVTTWATPASGGSTVISAVANHGHDCSFTRASSTFGVMNADSTCTFATTSFNSFPAITSQLSAGNKLPGITWTPAVSGTCRIDAIPVLRSATVSNQIAVQMVDGSSNVIGGPSQFQLAAAAAATVTPVTGILSVTASSAVTIQLWTADQIAETVTMGTGLVGPAVWWTVQCW